jgi:hypothetical protein
MTTVVLIAVGVLVLLVLLGQRAEQPQWSKDWEADERGEWEEDEYEAPAPAAPQSYAFYVSLIYPRDEMSTWILDICSDAIVAHPMPMQFIVGTNDLDALESALSGDAWLEEWCQVVSPTDLRECLTLPRGWVGKLADHQIAAARRAGCNVRVIARSNQRDTWGRSFWDCEVV